MRALRFACLALLTSCSPAPTPDAGTDVPRVEASTDAMADVMFVDAGMDVTSVDALTDVLVDAPVDVPNDAVDVPVDAGCQPVEILRGGSDVAAQGWSVVMLQPATITYDTDSTQLQTSTPTGRIFGGQLLLTRNDPSAAAPPFAYRFVVRVVSTNARNPLDSATAILGAFTPNSGSNAEREQMIYLDPNAMGFADNSASFTATLTDGAFHTIELAVDATRTARITLDGRAALMRNNFVTNGTIAIGDQSNDPNVDGTMQIRSIVRLCP